VTSAAPMNQPHRPALPSAESGRASPNERSRQTEPGRSRAPARHGDDIFVPPVRAPATSRADQLQHMMRYLPAEDTELRGSIASAAAAFSDRQIARMDRCGVVFAANRPGSLPAPRVQGLADAGLPAVPDTIQGTNTNGRYIAQMRTIQVRGTADGRVIHEMAHAWDDVREEPSGRLQRLGDAGNPRLQRQLYMERESHGFHSQGHLVEALADYRSHRPLPNMMGAHGVNPTAFSLTADHSEPMSNTREFYAEGFSVFHRGSAAQLEVLRRQAPMLYHALYSEARAEETLRNQPAPVR
jgi:hypothetical protein